MSGVASRSTIGRAGTGRRLIAFMAVPWLGLLSATAVHAQTDYYNTDTNRPVLIEDAYPTERFAFELQLAPLRLERATGGLYRWGIEPELAYGVFARTHVELGFPLVFHDVSEVGKQFGLAGVHLSMLHNLNIETAGLPAFGIAVDIALPVGGRFAPDRVYPSTKLIATRTYTFARFHVNGRYTFGPSPEAPDGAEELSRWYAGIAVDRTLPLRSVLLIADAYALQPLNDDDDVVWNVGGGVRYQLDPRFALDAGIGKRFGGENSWFLTFGTAYAFAVRSLIPVP
jgi:hypothetical protein